jgi:hypothetical protein
MLQEDIRIATKERGRPAQRAYPGREAPTGSIVIDGRAMTSRSRCRRLAVCSVETMPCLRLRT